MIIDIEVEERSGRESCGHTELGFCRGYDDEADGEGDWEDWTHRIGEDGEGFGGFGWGCGRFDGCDE